MLTFDAGTSAALQSDGRGRTVAARLRIGKTMRRGRAFQKAPMTLPAGNAEYSITVFFRMSENNVSPILTSFKDVKVNHRRSDADVAASCRCGAVIPDLKHPLMGCWNLLYSCFIIPLWNPARRRFLAETRGHEPETHH